jgi:hypothetical protein
MKMRTFFLNIFILWSHFLFTQEMEWDKFKTYLYARDGKIYFNSEKWNGEKKYKNGECGVFLELKILTNENLKISHILSYFKNIKTPSVDTIEPIHSQYLNFPIYSEFGCAFTSDAIKRNELSFTYSKNIIQSGFCKMHFICTLSNSRELQFCKKLIPDFKEHLKSHGGKIFYRRKVQNQSNMMTFMNEFTNKRSKMYYDCCHYTETFITTSPEKIIDLYGRPSEIQRTEIDSSAQRYSRVYFGSYYSTNLAFKYDIYVKKDPNYKEEILYRTHTFREDSKYFIFPIYFWFLEEKLVMVDYSMPIPYKVKPKRGIRGVFRRLGL